MSVCEYKELGATFDKNVEYWCMRSYVCAMLLGTNVEWFDMQMRMLAAHLLQTFKLDCATTATRSSHILECLKMLKLVDDRMVADNGNAPSASRTQEVMSPAMSASWMVWHNICTAIMAYINNTCAQATGQGVSKEVRVRDSCHAILFVAMVHLPGFVAWFKDAPEGAGGASSNAPAIPRKAVLVSFMENYLPPLVQEFVEGCKGQNTDVGNFVASARAQYFANVGVPTPEDMTQEQYDPLVLPK